VTTPPFSPEPSRILWVSPSYGYHGDLMYFGEIFRAFLRLFPNTQIPVGEEDVYINAQDLPLVPIAAYRRLVWKRMVRGVNYGASLALPRWRFIKRLWDIPADCLITIEFTPPALLAMAMGRLRPRMGRVLLVESDPRLRGGSSNPLVLAIKRWAVSGAHVIQTNTDEGAAYLTQTLGADPAKVLVAPYLTSCPPYPDTRPPAEVGRLRLLFVNSLQPRKGLDHLLGALALLPAEVASRIDVTIVGNGPERETLQSAAATLQHRIAIRFEGAKPYSDLGRYYAAADVLVIPSLVDYRSLAGFEGLAYGLALIQSRFDGASRETVVEGETGFTIDPTDHAQFAQHIAALASDPALLARCKAGSAKLYAQRYSIAQIADNLAASTRAAMAAARG
jgi:glycosyltransferase involved in cell wall biosynthesis